MGITSSKVSRHDVYDEQNSLAVLVAIEFYGDDLQLAVAFVVADVAPTVVAPIGGRPGWGRVSHNVTSRGPADAVPARGLREPDLH